MMLKSIATQAGILAGPDGMGNFNFSFIGTTFSIESEAKIGNASRPGKMSFIDEAGNSTLQFLAINASLRVGGYNSNDKPGNIYVYDQARNPAFMFQAKAAELTLGTSNNYGRINVNDANLRRVLEFDADSANLDVGSLDKAGTINVTDATGHDALKLDGAGGKFIVKDASGKDVFNVFGHSAQLSMGGEDNSGSIFIWDSSRKEVFRFLGEKALLEVGGGERENAGTINVKGISKGEVLKFDGKTGKIQILNHGQAAVELSKDGSIEMKTSDEKSRIILSAGIHQITILKDDKPVAILATDSLLLGQNITNADAAAIHLNGTSGDILLRNADCSEYFDVSEQEEAEHGSVMVIDENGKLRRSHEPYDKRVAGVVSGAGDYRPGIILDKKVSEYSEYDENNKRVPISMMGKVYCKVDADYSQIELGDMLTTSPTPGHAMKATDSSKCFGAIVGKALRAIRSGKGLIPILIALQ